MENRKKKLDAPTEVNDDDDDDVISREQHVARKSACADRTKSRRTPCETTTIKHCVHTRPYACCATLDVVASRGRACSRTIVRRAAAYGRPRTCSSDGGGGGDARNEYATRVCKERAQGAPPLRPAGCTTANYAGRSAQSRPLTLRRSGRMARIRAAATIGRQKHPRRVSPNTTFGGEYVIVGHRGAHSSGWGFDIYVFQTDWAPKP